MIAALVLVSACVLGDDLTALDKMLRATDERERRTGVQEAAKLDSKEGWTRVIDALADVSAQVADEAEVQLAKLHDASSIADLCGKRGLLAKDPWVAAHAAGAIGSITSTPVPSASLVPALATKSTDAKSILCASIEKLQRANQLGDPGKLASELASMFRKDDSEVRAAALLALATLPNQERASAADWAGEHDPAPVTCAILRLGAGATDEKTRKYVRSRAHDADRSVRGQALETLSVKPDADALKTLVAMLEVEKNKRLAFAIDAALEKLSGLDGGGKPDFWRKWVDNLGPEWKPATGEAKPRSHSGDTHVVELVGMPIVSGAVAILVDFSGSTWQKRADGKTRKDKLDEELKKSLEALPADTLFNVIPYTAIPIPWEKAVQAATPSNVQRALKFFVGCKATGKGNFWDAAMLALEDPAIDTILVLTDGAPTGGHRWNIDLMRERYVERNRWRHVVLDSVIVDAKKGLEERWRKLCEATSGRMLAVDLK